MLNVGSFSSTNKVDALVSFALESLKPIGDCEYAIAACKVRSVLEQDVRRDDIGIYLGRQRLSSPCHHSRHKQPQPQIPQVLEVPKSQISLRRRAIRPTFGARRRRFARQRTNGKRTIALEMVDHTSSLSAYTSIPAKM